MRTRAAVIKDLQDNDCALSPENLTCDGELAPYLVMARRRKLLAERAALVKELGHEPTDAELYPELYGPGSH